MRTITLTTVFLLSFIYCGGVYSDDLDHRQLLKTFALEMFDPGMRWAYTSNRIRTKILSRWGPPDTMETSIKSDTEVPPIYWAEEIWAYEHGPTITIASSEDGESLRKITLGVNTQINLALGLWPGATRGEFYKKLGIKDDRYVTASSIKFHVEEQTRKGHVSVEVTILFDERDFSERVMWEVVPGH